MNRPKFYTLEEMTQEDLNKLALERNTMAKKIDNYDDLFRKLEKFLKRRIKRVPETMAEAYEDELILERLQKLKNNYKFNYSSSIIRCENTIENTKKYLNKKIDIKH